MRDSGGSLEYSSNFRSRVIICLLSGQSYFSVKPAPSHIKLCTKIWLESLFLSLNRSPGNVTEYHSVTSPTRASEEVPKPIKSIHCLSNLVIVTRLYCNAASSSSTCWQLQGDFVLRMTSELIPVDSLEIILTSDYTTAI